MNEQQKEDLKALVNVLTSEALKRGNEIREREKREPKKSEAAFIAADIERQFKMALALNNI